MRIAFIGDVFTRYPGVQASEDLRRITASSDIVVANLESPITQKTSVLADKSTHLRSDPSVINLLKGLSTNVVCIANNHICDYGLEGLMETIKLLEKNQIRCIGAGENKHAAESAVVIEKQDLKIGFLAFGREDIDTPSATESGFGCAVTDEPHCLELTRKLSEEVKLVLVCVHWGSTNYHYPLPKDIDFGMKLLDAGATAVIGHHPHVVQGYQLRNNKAIIYSLGNFCFSDYQYKNRQVVLEDETRIGMLVLLNVNAEGIKDIEIAHTQQIDHRGNVELLPPKKAAYRESYLRKLTEPLYKTDYGSFFRCYMRKRMLSRIYWAFNPLNWHNLRIGHLRGLGYLISRSLKPLCR